ncbi:MAG: patatin-like phospholipase family protein [Chromatiales bacterium]
MLLSIWLLGGVPLGLEKAYGAQTVRAEPNPNQRPKIGLVLAGGGAKGAAHVGVLKVLEELRIPIDYIAGTSMGAIIGGLYASGMTPQEIGRVIDQIDWADIFVDKPDREDRSYRRKTDDRLYLFKAKPGFNDGKLEVPLGYIHGQKFDLELNRLTQGVANIKDFDRLPIPFRAVAADLETGQEVVLRRGSLARSIRASMAVPGAFDPVEIDGKILVDGGIANNIPISVARDMGAEVVIVSDLGSDLYSREKLTTGLEVAGQMINFLFALNSQEQLKTLTDDDVHIEIELGDIGSGSFDRIAETIPLGEQAARRVQDSLGRYSLSAKAYRRYAAAHRQPKIEAPVIHFVKIENDSELSDDVITSYVTLKPGDPLDIDQLEREIQQLYGLDIFDSVRYEVTQENGEEGLVLYVKSKPYGPGYLQAGMITSSDFDGDTTFRLGLVYMRTELNELNGEWRLGGQLGDEPALFTELYQPLDPAARYFVFGHLGYDTRITYEYDDGYDLARYFSRMLELELGAGRQLGTWGELRLGYRLQQGTTEVDIGPPAPDTDFDIGQLYLRMSADELDNLNFPTKGYFGTAEVALSDQRLGSDSDFEQLRLTYLKPYSWDRNTLIGTINLRSTLDDDAPIENQFRLGGFLRLSGYGIDRLTGQQAGLASLIYMRRVVDVKLAKTYVGGSLEAGNVWQDSNDISLNNLIYAGSAFVGVDTPIGPLYLGYGRSDTDEGSLYLYLGPLPSF